MKKGNSIFVFGIGGTVGLCILIFTIKSIINSGYDSDSAQGILLFGGGFWMLIGYGAVISNIIEVIKHKILLTTSKVLYATVDFVNCETGPNGKYARYSIQCSYVDPQNGMRYDFVSKPLYYDPSEIFPEGSTIEVVVNPKNYKKYYVKAQEKIDQKIIDFT